MWQLTRQFCWDFVNHLQLACVKRQIKGNFMNGLIIPYNVNKYTQARNAFRNVSELLLIYYFCTFSLRMTAIVWILFIHFYGFRFFNDQDIGEPSPLPPHLSMGCGAKKVWSFYPLFLLLLSRAMQNPNMILRLLPCILPHRRISYRSNEAVRFERANRVQVSS